MRLCDKCIHDKVCLLSKSRASCLLFDEYRPHGKWITKKNSFQTFCSNCDKAIPYSDEYDFSDFIFCPYCGADMRDKKEDLAEIIEAAQSMKDRSEAE